MRRARDVLLADRWLPLVAFVAVAAVVVLVSQLAYANLGRAVYRLRVPQIRIPANSRWLGAWTWWDGAWYVEIAKRGYSFMAGRQSPVAFFPLYPLAMRAVARVVGHPALAGFVLTLSSGAVAVTLFYRWCSDRLDRGRAGAALALLLLYPCAFYLMGAVYADAMFLAISLGAFVALERGHPTAAGLLCALATAARPTGAALAVALWMRARELRKSQSPGGDDASARWSPARPPRPFPRAWPGLLIAPAGLIAYCAFLAVRFGDPFAFVAAEGAPGWNQAPGFHTWFKIAWIHRMKSQPYFNALHYHLVASALITVVALVLVPRVFRRFGKAYGLYALLMVAGAAWSTRDFTGMGRYVMVAFPCFAAAADCLVTRRPRALRPLLVVSAGMLVFFAQLHARNMLIS